MAENTFREALPHPLQPNEQLYFLHLAKTAGRSLEAFLKLQFAARETIRIDVENGYPETFEAAVFSGYRLYLGHLGYHFLELFPQSKRPYWITMLRDPVDRVLSYYYFFRNMQPVEPGHISYRHQVLATTLSLREFVESHETAELVEDFQFRDLLDSEMLLPDLGAVKRRYGDSSLNSLLQQVKDRLSNECAFFGLTERYASSLALLCYTFDWELPAQESPKLNVTSDKPGRSQIPPDAIDAIQERVTLDTEIYAHACGLFEQRLNEMQNRLLAERGRSLSGSPARRSEGATSPATTPAASPSVPARYLSKARNRLRALGISLGRGAGIVKPPALFDPDWYLKQNPDVARAGVDPYVHYKVWGWREGRSPSAGFDVRAYLADHPELLRTGQEPLTHAMAEARRRSRKAQRTPSKAAAHSISVADFASSGATTNPGPDGRRRPARLCFHFPASPNDAFYSQIAMFRLSLDSLGGIYQQADIHIMFGDEEIKEVPPRWKSYLGSGLRTNWVAPEVFRQHRYDAQGDAQWKYDYQGYDFVCIADADVMILKPIDDLLVEMIERPALVGAIAHVPFPPPPGTTPKQEWNRLAARFIQKPLDFDYRYSFADAQPAEYTYCPFYVNFGFLLMTPGILSAVGDTHRELRPLLARTLAEPFYAAQVSLALSVAACNVPCRAVGLRYNFPNDDRADDLHRNELSDVRIIHFLRTELFDRQKIFTSAAEFDRFLSLDLRGSNRAFQERIRQLTGGRYPFS